MALYGIITQTSDSFVINPGTQFILYGLMHLIKQADPHAQFCLVSQDRFIDDEWHYVTENADFLVFGGGPRFNSKPESKQYCDWGIWTHINKARARGIPMMDLCTGATHYLPLQKNVRAMASRMAGMPKIQTLSSYYKGMALVTARDPIMSCILEHVVAEVPVLPCASYWAKDESGIVPAIMKSYNAIVIRRMPGHEWLIPKFETMAEKMNAVLLAHVEADRRWYESNGGKMEVEVINNPVQLMLFYAGVYEMVSMRLHGSVMGLSLGANVLNLATNSGSFCLKQFGVESRYFTELKRDIPLEFYGMPFSWNADDYRREHVQLLRNATSAKIEPVLS